MVWLISESKSINPMPFHHQNIGDTKITNNTLVCVVSFGAWRYWICTMVVPCGSICIAFFIFLGVNFKLNFIIQTNAQIETHKWYFHTAFITIPLTCHSSCWGKHWPFPPQFTRQWMAHGHGLVNFHGMPMTEKALSPFVFWPLPTLSPLPSSSQTCRDCTCMAFLPCLSLYKYFLPW